MLNPSGVLNIPLEESHRFRLFASLACDTIWFHKNKKWSKNITINPLRVVNSSVVSEHHVAWSSKILQVNLSNPNLKPTPANCFQAQVNAATRSDRSAAPVLILDPLNISIYACTKIMLTSYPLLAEAEAALLAAKLWSTLKLFVSHLRKRLPNCD